MLLRVLRLCVAVGFASAARLPPGWSSLRVRGGGAEDVESALGAAFSGGLRSVESAMASAEGDLRSGKLVEDLGAKCGAAYDKALAGFDGAVGAVDDAAAVAAARSQLAAAVDAKLELLFVSQLARVRKALVARGGSPSEGDAAFAAAAAAATRPGSAWDSSAERASLAAVLNELAGRRAKVESVSAKATSQQQAYIQLFQLYQAQIAQLKQAAGAQPAQLTAAYRVPDTDLALSASRANDRTTLTLDCVPDDSAPLLGPQGFVCGVTPLNVGFTLNLHV